MRTDLTLHHTRDQFRMLCCCRSQEASTSVMVIESKPLCHKPLMNWEMTHLTRHGWHRNCPKAGCLEIRNRQSSDRFNPLGMSQDVGLNDFLINSKIPAPWRDRIPLVVSPADGRIAWLAGIRPSEWAKLQPKHESALHLRMSSGSSQTETVDRSAP